MQTDSALPTAEEFAASGLANYGTRTAVIFKHR